MKINPIMFARLCIGLALAGGVNGQYSTAVAQGTAFTYQGQLLDGTNSANGNYTCDFLCGLPRAAAPT